MAFSIYAERPYLLDRCICLFVNFYPIFGAVVTVTIITFHLYTCNYQTYQIEIPGSKEWYLGLSHIEGGGNLAMCALIFKMIK
jgi:hypothetical protein